MKPGLIFPQTEIGNDPLAIRDYIQTAEELGFDHVALYEHVVGAGRATRPDWQGVYDYTDAFHEPFVLLGYFAALTTHIGLATDVLVLPQRQTVLVAKQAAEVDVLSNGRLRLGIGVGWNELEFVALNEDFHSRGKRVEEQMELMRALWTNEVIDFKGQWHSVPDAGIKPLPVQRPIPLWIGGHSDATLSRIARLADGWFPLVRPDEKAAQLIAHMRDLVTAAGRRFEDLGIEPVVTYRPQAESRTTENGAAWRELGATHLAVNAMNAGLKSAQEHIAAIKRIRQLLRDDLGI